MRTIRLVAATFGALLCAILIFSTFAKPVFGDDWGAVLWGDDTDLTVAVADSTNVDDGFDWYTEAEISWSDEYLYAVGLQAGYTCSQCDDHTDSDVEEDDAYVSGEQPLYPGMVYLGTATSYTCDVNQEGEVDYGINPSECDSDITAYIKFVAGVPSISDIAPSSDFVGNSGQITLQGEYLGDPFGGGFTSTAMTGSGVNLSNGSSTNDYSTFTLNYSIDQTAPVGAQYLTITNPFGTSNTIEFDVNSLPDATANVDPDNWQAGWTNQPITISGSNWGGNPSATVDVGDITLNVSPDASGNLSGTVTIPSNETATQANITVSFGSSYGSCSGGNCFAGNPPEGSTPPQPATASAGISSPPEVAVVGWINGNAIKLPSGENYLLSIPLPDTGPSLLSYGPCVLEEASWLASTPGDVNTAADAAYANAWLLKFSANMDPGKSITPNNFGATSSNYRLFNDFKVDQSWNLLIHRVAVGSTPDPCGNPVIVPDGDSSNTYNGTINTSLSGYKFQLAQGRVGSMGQTIYEAINNGATVPWIWSVIEFDQMGNSVNTKNVANYQIFPTYSVYVNGKLSNTIPQSSVPTVVNLNDSSQLVPPPQ